MVRGMALLAAGVAGLVAAEARAALVEARWTKAAEAQHVPGLKGGQTKTLPELRVYDARGRLILIQTGYKHGQVGAEIAAAQRLGRPLRGPSLAQSIAELETRDGRPLGRAWRSGQGITLFDYWAEWCVPCKQLGAELDAWAASRPRGSFTLVRAETDPMRALRARGVVVKHFMKTADGKMVEVKD